MFLNRRNRTLRHAASIRNMVAETHLHAAQLIAPFFLIEGSNKKEAIPSMPNYFRYSIDKALDEISLIEKLGIRAILLFAKCPADKKDNAGREAVNPNGLMQTAIRAIKNTHPEILVFTDVALDPYSIYGHDGIVENNKIANDISVQTLTAMALSHAQAGADFVAPSDMMDGRIAAIRTALEKNNFTEVGIMSYAAKYASALYGPFRDVLDSKPSFGDKKTYQMNFQNRIEAIQEVETDIQEGADIVMIKPASFYLDIIREVKNRVHIPVAAYQVSGEYAMIKTTAQAGFGSEQHLMVESLTAIARAGASIIVTYFAKDMAQFLQTHTL